MATTTVELYERDNVTPVLSGGDPVVFEATREKQVRGLSGVASLDDTGNGTIRISSHHPYADELTTDRIVRVTEDGRTPLAFFTDKVRRVRVAADGPAGRIIEAKGDGVRSVLRRGFILPFLDLAQERPLTTRRIHGGASPGIDTSDWTTPTVLSRTSSQPARPIAMPSNDSRWIWGETESDSMTIGDCWARRWFTLTEQKQVVFLVTADDIFDDWLHGCELQRVEPAFPAEVWHKPWRSPMLLNPGTYVYTVHATNQGGKGGLIAEAWTTTATGLDDMLFMSGVPTGGPLDFLYGEDDEAWQVLFNPADPPGMTPGEMVDEWLAECHARGELLDVSAGSYTAELDSAGDPWSEKVPLEVDATGTFEDGFDVLCASYVDGCVSKTDGLVIDMWNKDPGRGQSRPIVLQQSAKQIRSDETETDGKVENTVLLVHDRGIRRFESPLSVLAYGVRPGGKINCGSISDPAVLDQIATAYLYPRTNPQQSRRVEMTSTLEFDAEEGDTISVEDDEDLRVMEIGFELQPDGRLAKSPSLATPWQERVKRSDRLVDRMIRENGSSMASARVLDTGTNIPSGSVDTEELISWSWTDADLLDMEYWDLAAEEPVGWQEHVLPDARRLDRLQVVCKWAEPDGAGGLAQVTTGQSRFLLLIDGLPTSPPFIATVPETSGTSDPTISGIAYVFGEAFVRPLSKLSIAPIENGGHIEGAAAIWGTVPL